jgi:hypothetical protein
MSAISVVKFAVDERTYNIVILYNGIAFDCERPAPTRHEPVVLNVTNVAAMTCVKELHDYLSEKLPRHPELVSGSIYQLHPSVRVEKWMLKQVQHDGVGVGSIVS